MRMSAADGKGGQAPFTDLPLLVTPWIRAVPVDVLLQQLELALFWVLGHLPAVVRGFPSARPALAVQVGKQILFYAAPDVGSRTDVEDGLAAPQHVDTPPFVG